MLRLQLRPAELWPAALELHSERLTNERASASIDSARATTWAEILNSHPGRSVALDYLLQDIDTKHAGTASALDALLAELQGCEQLNEVTKKLVTSARQALAGNAEALADALGYSSEDNAQWRLVLRHIDGLSSELVNQFARQSFNRRAKVSAIEAGLASQILSDSTLENLLVLDDQEVLDLLIGSVGEDADRAMHYITLIRASDRRHTTAEAEARLLAVAVPADVLRQRHPAVEYSIRSWEALTYSAPEDMIGAARAVLCSTSAALRAELMPKLGETDRLLVDYLANEQLRAAAGLVSRQPAPTAEDIDLVLSWFAHEAAGGFLSSAVWRAMARIAQGASLDEMTRTLRAHVGVLGFSRSVKYLDSPLAAAIVASVPDGDSDDVLRAHASRWFLQQPERTNEELREALYGDEATVRMTAAKMLISRLDRDELGLLHDEYPRAGRQIWYNVLALFDEQLYAPTPPD